MKKYNLFGLIVGLALAISCQKESANISANMDEHFYVRNAGADMPVNVKGNGKSNVFILLLHGGPGDGSLKYQNHPFSIELEKDYAIAYWDQRHQGNSHGHLKKSDITIDAMVEDTYKVIKALKHRYGNHIDVFLMGHSWGGLLGTAYMLKSDYQYQVKGWIESAGAHDFLLLNKSMIAMIKDIAPKEIAKEQHTDKWQEILDYVNTLDPENISEEQATKLNGYAYTCESLISTLGEKSTSSAGFLERSFLSADNPVAGLANAAQLPESFTKEILKVSLTDQLHKIKTPTLLLWGKYDFAVPKAIAYEALLHIGTPNKSLKVYQHSGHSSMRYQPDLFVADVKQFIEKYK